MKKTIFSFVATLVASSACWAAPVSKAKVAELAAHRIDRLVTLGKIDPNFSSRMEKIEVTDINNGAAVYNARVYQTQPSNTDALRIDLSFDKDGKALAYKPVAGGATGPDPQWPDKDANSMTENCLHYVIDNAADAKVKPFNDSFVDDTLIKGDLGGKIVGRCQVRSSATKSVLTVYLNPDGSLNSTDITP